MIPSIPHVPIQPLRAGIWLHPTRPAVLWGSIDIPIDEGNDDDDDEDDDRAYWDYRDWGFDN